MSGNRAALPADAMKRCPACGTARGTVMKDWTAIHQEGGIVGFTCPQCPTWTEPIRRETSRAGVRFVAVVAGRIAGKRRQLKRRFDTLEGARAWVEEMRGLAATGQAGDPSLLTVREVCERWLAHRETEASTPGGLRPSSLEGYRLTLVSPLQLIGDRRARELTPSDIEAALRKLATVGGIKGKPLSHRSRTYALGALRQAFKFAQREGWLQGNPAALAKVQGKPAKTRQSQRWTVAQLQGFRAYVDSAYATPARLAAEPWVPAAMRLALCGLRRSEVLGLDWGSVDIEQGTVDIHASRTASGPGRSTAIGAPKTANSVRRVAVETLHPGTRAVLRALWLAQGQPADGLVIRDSLGDPVHPDTLSWRFKTLCSEAGVPFPGAIHATRHTLATALEEAGVPSNQGAALLGHDVQTYQRFYLVTDQDAAGAAATVAGSIFATATG